MCRKQKVKKKPKKNYSAQLIKYIYIKYIYKDVNILIFFLW